MIKMFGASQEILELQREHVSQQKTEEMVRRAVYAAPREIGDLG